MSTAFPLAFAVGLLGTLHCIGMCGAIVGALGWSLPAEIRASGPRLAAYLLAYNLGRIASYAAAGALFGWLGAGLAAVGTQAWPMAWVGDLLRVLAALATVSIGLHLGGWLPRLVAVERLGAPVWRLIEPVARRLLPVGGLAQAALFGALWGWLPCGLVYVMLIGAPAQGGAGAGALYMALFGVGTLPALLAGGLLAGQVYRLGQDRRFRAVAGLAVLALGLSTLHFQGYNRVL